MKRILFAIGLSLPLLLTAAAHAQTTQLKVTVPFAFVAGHSALPAGDYDVQAISTWGGNTLSIRNVASNAGTLVLSSPFRSTKKYDRNALVFYRYGEKYLLAELWTANAATGRQLLLEPRQTELAGNQLKSKVVLTASTNRAHSIPQ